MTALHGLLSALAAVLLAALVVAGLILALARRDSPWLHRFRRAVLGLLVAEAAIGLALFVGGARPGELLHWLYAAAAVVALALVAAAEAEAPPRPRAGLVAAAGAFALIMVWRLSATG